MPDDSNYIISQKVLDRYPELIEMLKKSKSIEDEEKNYWFTALETMDEDQVASLRKILDDEQKELQKVDQNFDQKTEQALTETETDILEQKRKEAEDKRKQDEMVSFRQDEVKQEELLSLLNNL